MRNQGRGSNKLNPLPVPFKEFYFRVLFFRIFSPLFPNFNLAIHSGDAPYLLRTYINLTFAGKRYIIQYKNMV